MTSDFVLLLEQILGVSVFGFCLGLSISSIRKLTELL